MIGLQEEEVRCHADAGRTSNLHTGQPLSSADDSHQICENICILYSYPALDYNEQAHMGSTMASNLKWWICTHMQVFDCNLWLNNRIMSEWNTERQMCSKKRKMAFSSFSLLFFIHRSVLQENHKLLQANFRQMVLSLIGAPSAL